MNTQNELSPVLTAINSAKGLPNAHYTDPDTFAEEREAVLFANWSGIGFGKDIPEKGDARPVEFLGMPLLILRDHHGEIGVFQNTCRHRGMVLVDKPKNIRGTIRCPYHSWCYDLNGKLRAAPHIGGPGRNTHEDVDFATLGLFRIRSFVWRDVIFVNIDGTAPAFEDAHKELMERWADFEQPIYHGGTDGSARLEVKSNWKLAVENYCESYHLPWVHPGLNSYSRLEDHYNIIAPGKYSGQGTYVYRQLEGDNGKKLDDFTALDPKWEEGAEYIAVYPNVLLGVQRDHAFAFIIEPVSHEETIEHIELYYATNPEHSPGNKDLRARNATLWRTVFEEDIFVVEGMQKGRHGIMFDGGRFSPVMDGPTHCFHQWVASQIETARSRKR